MRVDISRATDRVVGVAAVGDFRLDETTARRALGATEGMLAPDLREILRTSELALLNLEASLFTGASPIRKSGLSLPGSPEMVELMTDLGIDIVSLANNHILDFGPEAMFQTQRACESGGIRTVGIGETRSAAEEPVIIEASGLRIGVLAFAEREFNRASSQGAGVAILDPVRSAQAVRRIAPEVDLVIVSAHGGNEHYFAPSPRTQAWYRSLVDAGAHAILGHHPHTVQGVEIYRDAPIVYSMGNFLFPLSARLPASWQTGLLVQLQVSRNAVHSVELHPIRQDLVDGVPRVRRLEDGETESFHRRLEQLNRIAADPTAVEEHWRCLCAELESPYSERLVLGASTLRVDWRGMLAAGARGSALHLGAAVGQLIGRIPVKTRLRKTREARLCNLLQCPAHHELMTGILQMKLSGETPDPVVAAEFASLIRDCRADRNLAPS